MNKKSINKIVIISIVLVLVFIIVIYTNKIKTTKKESYQLSEIKIIACNTADEVGSCDTRLNEVGIVSKEECCQYLGKCCGGV